MLRRYRACWADPAHASVVIAAALRPTVPRPASLPVLLSGTTAAGKTFSSAAIMAFWQARPGDWTGQSLPGSSADTAASTEHALARTPIWVMDDLAPSATDPARQARAADTMNEIIRAVFNNAAHRRMTRDLTSRAAESPRAVFVCSAEAAPLSNHSVMNRLVHIRVQPGFLVPQRGPTDALIEMSQTSNEQSLLTGYALLLNARAAQRDWPGERRGWADDAAGVERQVRHVIDSRFTKAAYAERVARTVADLSLGLVMLERVIDSLRMRDEQFGDPVRPEASFGEVLESMFEDIMQVALDGVCEGKDIAPGRTTIARLRSLLGSAKAHIAASDGTPGAPMVAGEDGCSPDANAVNQALGWVLTGDSNRPATPGGVRVGWLHRGGDGQPMVLADPGALFNLVRREFGRDGHSQKSLFDALWAEGFCTERHWKRKQTGKGLCYTVRVSTAGQMLNVIPLTLQLVLGNDGEDDG